MNGKLENFFRAEPEVVIEWQDKYSPARGWLVMNSLRGGAAGGGTRLKSGCTKKEVVGLAKTMEIKFAICGPNIGGAKSGIDYDYKNEKDKCDILRRWFRYIEKELKTCYGTGGDQNVNQTEDVMPILAELNIGHPQEGIVRGHYSQRSRRDQDKIIDQLRRGVLLLISKDEFLHSLNCTISDVATGYGVVKALSLYYNNIGDTLFGKRILMEGLGNVGGAAAYYATQEGAQIVGVLERDWYASASGGINLPQLYKDFRSGRVRVGEYKGVQPRNGERVESTEADVFIPAATSATVDLARIDQLKQMGIKVFSCGANNPFADSHVVKVADRTFSILPDFLANAGMARVFAYLMHADCQVRETSILDDIEECMSHFTKKLFSEWNNTHGLIAAAEDIVFEQLGDTS